MHVESEEVGSKLHDRDVDALPDHVKAGAV